MGIIEGNELIAEFIGKGSQFKEAEEYFILEIDGLSYSNYDGCEYHSSWSWIMPVVEKIVNKGYTIDGVKAAKHVSIAAGSAHLAGTWMYVCAFIEWYNEQPIPIMGDFDENGDTI